MSEEKKQSQGFYAQPSQDSDADCASCFYQGAVEDSKEENLDTDDCASCFYQGEDDPNADKGGDDCPSCFYQGAKE